MLESQHTSDLWRLHHCQCIPSANPRGASVSTTVFAEKSQAQRGKRLSQGCKEPRSRTLAPGHLISPVSFLWVEEIVDIKAPCTLKCLVKVKELEELTGELDFLWQAWVS
jgi:hypothetical protein